MILVCLITQNWNFKRAIHRLDCEKIQYDPKDSAESQNICHHFLAELEVGIGSHDRNSTCPSHSGAFQPPWSFQSHVRNHYWHDLQNHVELPLKVVFQLHLQQPIP